MNLKKSLQFLLLSMALFFVCASTALSQSDQKATALAQKVLQNMGGQKGWDDTRFLAWTFNDQYQVWDKHEHKFRWEKDSLVVLIDTQTKEGKVYVEGRELKDQEEARKLKERAYALWINNSYWLVMPFKLQDPGVRLKYVGEGITMGGAAADILEMTFDNVGLTPQNKYHVWIDKQTGLVTQWAFFRNYSDAEPAFTRRWSDYQDYGKIKLASDRSNPQSDFKLTNLAAPASVSRKVFNSPTPVNKAGIK